MTYEAELDRERAYTARVQQLLASVIAMNRENAVFQDDTIRMILADTWDELRMKPTALSPWDLDQLNAELSRFVARRSFSADRAAQYEKMLGNPFFARIDFAEDGEESADKIVIGLYSLKDPDGSLLVHDWRAPVCSLYYDAIPGRASFESPSGTISGLLTLKRQYRMEKGRLKYFVDTDYSIDDAMLLDILSGASEAHMRQIVSTIQSEQNLAIRCERARVLTVTGGAGSGKTSVAMHRAAYLLYRHRDSLDAQRICMLAPSDAFCEYISTVLPDLGEDNTRSSTLKGIVEKLIGKRVETPVQQYEALFGPNQKMRRESVRWKSGAELISCLDRAAERFISDGPNFSDVSLGGRRLFAREELERMYRDELKTLTPAQRLSRTLAQAERRLGEIEKTLYSRYEKQLIDSYKNKELDFATRMAVAQKMRPVRAQLNDMLTINLSRLYAAAIESDAPEILAEAARENADANLIWYEDAPGLAYLALRLGCAKPDTNILHLLVDEAQEYADVSFKLMKLYYPRAAVTLLGDPNQRTLPGLPECHPESWGALFGESDAPHITLTRGYRSTKEIADFCAAFLPEGAAVPQPFGRSGEAPEILPFSADALNARLNAWLDSGIRRAAVVAPTQRDAEALSRQIKGSFLLTGDVNELEDTGVTVASLALMKGLEFDAVAVVWPMRAERDEAEGRRLYTACSRALHRLTVFDTSTEK